MHGSLPLPPPSLPPSLPPSSPPLCQFPHSLAGMGFLFTALLSLQALSPDMARSAYSGLKPGADFFKRWLPVRSSPALSAGAC